MERAHAYASDGKCKAVDTLSNMGCRGTTGFVVVDVGYDGCAFPYVAGKGMFRARGLEQPLKLTFMGTDHRSFSECRAVDCGVYGWY